MGGYDIPKGETCPYCGATVEADWVDVGVGMVQCGPYHCTATACLASEIGPNDDPRELMDIEKKLGWYAPNSPAGSSANVDADGNIITYYEADTLYRDSCGVAPRYDAQGRLLSS